MTDENPPPVFPTMETMKLARRWLLSNPSKQPFYIDGRPRSGTLDSPEDILRLSTFDHAVAAHAKKGTGWNLGFALGPDGTGNVWQGIDLDKVATNRLSDLANNLPGYVEVSVGGEGAHAVGYGRPFATLGSNGTGVEAYSNARYFIVTNRPVRDGGLTCLANYVEIQLAPRHVSARVSGAAAPATFIAPHIVSALRSALNHLRSDDRDLWITIGLALKELGEVGRGLWLDWSQMSEKFDPRDAARVWDSVKPHSTGYQAVFAEAQRRGWINPDSNAARLLASSDGQQQMRDSGSDWPDPKPLPAGLLPVPEFDLALLPHIFGPWVADIAERMQVPGEFVAVPAMVAAGATIGNRLGIRPLQHDDWHVVPNVWGFITGRPGAMKSPAVGQALAPLDAMQARAREEYGEAMKAWEAGAMERELRADAAKSAARRELKNNPNASLSNLDTIEPEAPILRRYVANDTTYQALGELLIQNPRGLLVHRDELVSLLRALDRDDASEARGFYLTGADGVAAYTFDRIMRGKNIHVPTVTLAMLGSAQPGTIRDYASAAIRGGRGDDGLIQRFGMLVWPDQSGDWRQHDRQPSVEARMAARDAFERLDKLSPRDIGAECDRFDVDGRRPFLHFDGEAQELFSDWRQGYERRLRSGERHPALESHIAKYRKLIPSLALIHHLVEGRKGSVGKAALLSALAWGEFLEAHAERFYAAASNGAADGAATILRHIRRGALGERFTAREVHRRDWANLTERERVGEALDMLEDHGFIRSVETPEGQRKQGRPSSLYIVNPKGLRR
jgi:hypothetical protein